MRKFDGIAAQVEQNLSEAQGIAGEKGRQTRVHMAFQADMIGGPRPQQHHNGLQLLRRTKRLLLQLQPVGFYFGKIQQIVNNLQQ